MTYFSLFSAIGGFELGFPKEWQCVGFSEINKYAIQIYKQHFPDHKNYGDTTLIDTNQLPDFNLLCGGFPCQAFSIAGKRQGFKDTRGTLFFEICRIAQAKRPSYLFLENVKGLVGYDSGRILLVMFQSLDELGYDLQWQVLNSKNYGVPQNRERVFIVGNLRGTPRPKVFPIGTNNKIPISKKPTVYCLDANYYKGVCKQGRTMIMNVPHGWNNGFVKPYPNLRAERNSAHNELLIHNSSIRRLTPLECERLQGFPDNFSKYGIDSNGNKVKISDTQRYKCLGNAVTVNVVEAIMEKWLND